MCGVAGFFGSERGVDQDRKIIRKMIDAVVHRGPDGEGVFVEPGIALGHRRLAIIDLTPDGAQPMFSSDGRYVLVYNGMLYNYRELREELYELGVRFRSVCDTEVVLYGLAVWGPEALTRFNGMFALGFFDSQSGDLILARDRYGIKPLYFTKSAQQWIFASEIKAIIAHPDVAVRLNEEALLEYFTFQNFFTDRTLFDEVTILPPGHFIRFGRDGSKTDYCYWDFDFEENDDGRPDSQWVEELDHLFTQAVKRQLASDVQVGAFLSGGIDSGSIASVSAQSYPNLRSFTIGFHKSSASGLESGFVDEREQAELIASHIGSEHYEMVLKSGDMVRAMPSIVNHLEEPRVGQSYPNYYASSLASLASKVVLSGAGGDELFGGYPWRYYRAVTNASFEDYIDKYYLFWQRLIPNRIIHQVFHPIWHRVKHVWTRDIFRDVLRKRDINGAMTPERYVNLSMYFEAKTFLHGLLVVDDKLSMAHGIETRVPFLDNDLVDFAMRVPVRLKLANLGEVVRLNENDPGPKTAKYFEKTRDGKLLLRRVVERYVPRQVVDAEKRGFSGPDAAWFRGPSLEYVKNTLLSSDAMLYNFFDRAATAGLIEEHLSGEHNRRLLIWSLLNFELWCRKFLN